MSLKAFFKFVEIQTKLASVIPFLLGTAYMYYRFHTFNWINAGIMFVSLLLFDMTTTAINNYMDFKTAVKKEGFGYEEHNSIVKHNISPKVAKGTIMTMLFIAAALGIVLFFRTNVIVLILGAISFGIGVCYTFGPMPISRTPFGELFSGLTMGFIIPFLAAYIHVYDSALVISSFSQQGEWLLSIDLIEIAKLFLFMIPAVVCIANIMLANNICDMEDDLANGRKTMALWLGEKTALYIFAGCYIAGYAAIALSVILGIIPVIFIGALLSGIIVGRHVSLFIHKHVKAETFVLSVKNFMLMNGLNLAMLCVCILLF